ncbi:MAG: 2-hydroxychromene-2-carboxylate isomerase [Kofleriaceae bacterium]|nr:2-hydroxychromene-2-carboxylate isomerase [Kofleriaceae bacterium]
MATQLEFFFDIGSAYSYLASTQLPGLAARTGVVVRWRPFLLGAVFKATGNDMPARIPAKARWMMHDLQLWSHHYGVPIRVPSRFPINTLRTQRALAAIELAGGADAVAAAATALFRAYWIDDQDVSADAVISACVRAAGGDGDVVVAAIDAPASKDHLRASTDEAIRRGAFGAPAMFLGEQLFFGNDRLPLVEAALRAR